MPTASFVRTRQLGTMGRVAHIMRQHPTVMACRILVGTNATGHFVKGNVLGPCSNVGLSRGCCHGAWASIHSAVVPQCSLASPESRDFPLLQHRAALSKDWHSYVMTV